jgi:ribosomal protein S18 acetylase RimI-like enzyme
MTPTILPLEPAQRAAFFAYLADQLADNGTGGQPLFMPMAPGRTVLGESRLAAFSAALDTPLDEPGWRRAWLAWDGAQIAGHVDLRARPEPGAEHRIVLGMGVHRACRRRGIARALLDRAHAWARERGKHWIDLEVMAVNAPARALYERQGFRQTGIVEDMFRIDGQPYDYVSMSLRV